jgi:hypothetical protein
LGPYKITTRAVHGYALELLIYGGKQACDLNFILLPQNLQRPSTVFAAAPGK